MDLYNLQPILQVIKSLSDPIIALLSDKQMLDEFGRNDWRI